MTRLVLVPGAWHGSWCWQHVTPLLDAAGVPHLAVDLPGRDLYEDSDHLRSLLDHLDEPVALVGHSYGGAVITDAGDHPAVSSLVYLAALLVDEGESCSTAGSLDPHPAAISHAGRPDLFADASFDDGLITLDPVVAADCLYDDCEPRLATWAVQQLRPQGQATLGQVARRAAWRSKPSTYVVCERDRALHPDLQRSLATRCHRTATMATGHSPFLSAPAELARLLTQPV